MVKTGDIVLFKNCVCGEGALTDGNSYEVISAKPPLFLFIDDSGKKRIRNIQSRCFSIIEGKGE